MLSCIVCEGTLVIGTQPRHISVQKNPHLCHWLTHWLTLYGNVE